MKLESPYTCGVFSAIGFVVKHDGKHYNLIDPSKVDKAALRKIRYSRFRGHYEILHSIVLSNEFVPLDYELESKLEWFAGVFDCIGYEANNGDYGVLSKRIQWLFDIQVLLNGIDVKSEIVNADNVEDNKNSDMYMLVIKQNEYDKLVNLGFKSMIEK